MDSKVMKVLTALDELSNEQRDNFDKVRDLRRVEKSAKRMADTIEERLKQQGLLE